MSDSEDKGSTQGDDQAASEAVIIKTFHLNNEPMRAIAPIEYQPRVDLKNLPEDITRWPGASADEITPPANVPCEGTLQRIWKEASAHEVDHERLWTAFVENTQHKFDPIVNAAWEEVKENMIPTFLFPTPARLLQERVNHYVMALIEQDQGNIAIDLNKALINLKKEFYIHVHDRAKADKHIALLTQKIDMWIKNPPAPEIGR